MKIGVIGLGYVGLPLVCNFLRCGKTVYGFDIDKAKIKNGCLYVGKKSNIYKLGKNYFSIVRSLSSHNYIIPKNINKKIEYQPIEMDVGDILLFDWKCPHFSKKNFSTLIRRQIYITYCAIKNKNPRKRYYLDRNQTKSSEKKLSLLN